MAVLQIPPFKADNELVPSSDESILNEPHLDIGPEAVNQFLRSELDCPVLDELYPYLHAFTTKSSSHIAPLHDHVGKGRKITVTEKPGLHLVRYYATIYVKPIPHCLINFAFWERYLRPLQRVVVQPGPQMSELSPI